MMRINEIISENLLIIKLRKMKVKFDVDFNLIVEAHSLLTKSRSPARHRILLGDIGLLKNDMHTFLNYDFDPDPEIDQLKLEANNILNELGRIEQEIP